MKKITVIIPENETDSMVKALRDAGVVHVEHVHIPDTDDLNLLRQKENGLKRVLNVLGKPHERNKRFREPESMVREVLDLAQERDVLEENIRRIRKDLETWEDWEDFDPGIIRELGGKGIIVQLAATTKGELEKLPSGVIWEELFRKGKKIYGAAVSAGPVELPFPAHNPPKIRLEKMREIQSADQTKINRIRQRLDEIACCRESLVTYGEMLNSQIMFHEVRGGVGHFKKLSYISGFCPERSVAVLERFAKRQGAGLAVEGPSADDQVPTLMENPRWVQLINPVFRMIGTIPGYRELDISLWFLIFFSVFFGMLVGDAGYGILFWAASLLCFFKFGHKIKNASIFPLINLLSVSAIIWGILSGTFFGQQWLPSAVKPLLPALRDSDAIQALCFLIGVVHLSIAHLWKLIRKFPALQAWAEAGWVLILWAAYLLAEALILSRPFPVLGSVLTFSGAVLVITFKLPDKNVLKRIGAGLGDLLLHVINSFTDIVSYIRLFAVGFATVAVADAMNQMAAEIGFSGLLPGLAASLILLVGHTLNILLGAMALLVHGVRLNVLEFSSHLDMEWSGIEYKPFKNIAYAEGEYDE